MPLCAFMVNFLSLPTTETIRFRFWEFPTGSEDLRFRSFLVLSVLIKSCVFHGFFFNLSTSLTRDYKTFLIVLQQGTTVSLRGWWTACPTSWPGVWTRHNLRLECFCASRLIAGGRLGTADVRPAGTRHLSTGPAVSSFLACPVKEQGPCWGASCAPTSRWTIWFLPALHGTYQEGLYFIGPAACHCDTSGTDDSTYSPSKTIPDLRGTGLNTKGPFFHTSHMHATSWTLLRASSTALVVARAGSCRSGPQHAPIPATLPHTHPPNHTQPQPQPQPPPPPPGSCRHRASRSHASRRSHSPTSHSQRRRSRDRSALSRHPSLASMTRRLGIDTSLSPRRCSSSHQVWQSPWGRRASPRTRRMSLNRRSRYSSSGSSTLGPRKRQCSLSRSPCSQSSDCDLQQHLHEADQHLLRLHDASPVPPQDDDQEADQNSSGDAEAVKKLFDDLLCPPALSHYADPYPATNPTNTQLVPYHKDAAKVPTTHDNDELDTHDGRFKNYKSFHRISRDQDREARTSMYHELINLILSQTSEDKQLINVTAGWPKRRTVP